MTAAARKWRTCEASAGPHARQVTGLTLLRDLANTAFNAARTSGPYRPYASMFCPSSVTSL